MKHSFLRLVRQIGCLVLVMTAFSGVAQAKKPKKDVPEINPASAKAALILLSSGLLLAIDRSSK